MLVGFASKFNEIKCIPTNTSQIGKTVSRSISILMLGSLEHINDSVSVMSGFGVGLSTATVVLANTEV